MKALVSYQTPTCIFCNKVSYLHIDKDSYIKWCNGTLIQKAFPDEPIERREMILTGIHPECWVTNIRTEDQ